MESMNESRSIRVIIADDQKLVRAGFAMVIGSQPDMEVVGQASNRRPSRGVGGIPASRRGADGCAHARHGRH